MRILLIAHHACSRMQKQANALIEVGHEVSCISHRIPENWAGYKNYVRFYTGKQLRDAVKLFEKDIDVIHVHNEPNWLAIVAREASNKPIVMDIHDSMAYRTDDPERQSNEERIAFDMVDGMVLVSDKCVEITQPKVPYAVLPPYVNRSDFKLCAWTYRGGIVYEGRIDLPGETDGIMDYCEYTELCNAMRDNGVPFNIYFPKKSKKTWDHYEENGAIMQNPLEFNSLLKALGMYDWGFCGNIKPWKDWQLAMPNKLFEYLAAGIPVIAMNAELVGKFVEEHGVGINVTSVEEIKERWDERAGCQKNVFLKRHEFCMENHIHVVEDLYKELLK